MATEPIDYRALCAELADALDHNRQCLMDDRSLTHPLADRARAALAEPQPEAVGPTDEELLSLDYLRESWNAQADYMNNWDQLGTDEIIWWAQRQALARWGHQPAPPAEEEVGELAVFLRGCAEDHYGQGRRQFTRAADLLEQRHPAPVPVNERLPGPEDCDENGDCWFDTGTDVGWMLCDKVFGLRHGSRWWLPANALPLPGEEVQP